MKRSVRTALAAGLGALAVTFVNAPPAAANNLDFPFYDHYTGAHLATATYDDLTDTYCIRYVSGHTSATLVTSWTDGTGVIKLVDGADAGRNCTGNLSITEDRQRKVYILASEWKSEVRYHFS